MLFCNFIYFLTQKLQEKYEIFFWKNGKKKLWLEMRLKMRLLGVLANLKNANVTNENWIVA